MKPAPFAYARPSTVDEAVRLLADASAGSSRPLAGGQSLVPMLNLRLAPVDRIVDIGGLAEFRRTEDRTGSILYGALTTHAAFEDGAVPDASNGLMPYVAARIAFRAVRNRGTIGGALALADPAADWLPTVVALGATLHLVGPDGERTVPAEKFVLGPYFTALGEGELLAAIEVPKRTPSERWGHAKVTTKVGEYAESLAIAVVDRPQRTARAVLGAADGAPIILSETTECVLAGERPESLREVIRRELIAAERDFAPAKLTMHTTTLLRAIRDAAA
jgi:aerobic carbon-monoxide dehydrogenase medium subunit